MEDVVVAWRQRSENHCMEQTLAFRSHHCMEQTLAGGSHHCMEQTLAGGSHGIRGSGERGRGAASPRTRFRNSFGWVFRPD